MTRAVMDGDDDSGRVGETASFEKARIGRVAVIHIVIVAAIVSDRQSIGIGGNIGDAMLL